MDYKKAFVELDIEVNEINDHSLHLKYLKEKYRKQALKYHPDKNGNTPESTEKFQRINEAYHFLKKEIKHIKLEKIDLEEEEDSYDSSVYLVILQHFIQSIFQGKYTQPFLDTIQEIVMGFQKSISLKLFDPLDKETALAIYHFLSRYRTTFHLSQENIDQIKEVVFKKYENVSLYKLNPSIDDLLNNNIYKLYVEDQLYLVPLWYHELHFENIQEPQREILVLCEPELPEFIQIDEENHLHIQLRINFQEIQQKMENELPFEFTIGTKVFEIPLYELTMKKKQCYQLKSQGLTKIVEKDMYDVSEKSDILVEITITP
jgi:curved DNA-binding protein CbpA